MKRPVLFVALGMVLTFVMLAGVVIITSNALAGTRLREFGNGDIDVNIVLSRPTATLHINGNQSHAGNAANDALRQRDLEYEEKLREVIRMSQTAAPAPVPMEPTETATPLPAEPPAQTVTPVLVQPTSLPATLPAIASDKSAEVKATSQPLANTPAPIQLPAQPAQQVVPPAPTSDDHGGDRNTPEPVAQPPAQQPPPPAPTDDHGGSDNSGPSQSNTPQPPDANEGSSDNSGRDKPPEPPKEPKP